MGLEEQNATYQKIRLKEENDKITNILKPYASFLVRYPSVVFGLTLFVVLFSALLGTIGSLGAKDFPDFSKPNKGFETRGTVISARYKAYENLYREDIADGNLLNYNISAASINFQTSLSRKRRHSELDNTISTRQRRQIPFTIDINSIKSIVSNSKFVLVYRNNNGNNLLTLANILAICKIYESKIATFSGYSQNSEVHHLPNYIAKYYGKNSCRDLKQNNVDDFVKLLQHCASFYKSGDLRKCDEDSSKCTPTIQQSQCYNHFDASIKMAAFLYNIYYYMFESAYFEDTSVLKITSSFTDPGAYTEEGFYRPLYDDLLKDLTQTEVNGVKIVAYDLGDLKFNLFQTEIIIQSLWIIGAMVCVILFIWFFSGSIFIGLMTLCCIVFALVIAYFVYGRIFDMEFFPFLNMVTLIFIVGIGADDAFVYTGIWEEAKHAYIIRNKEEHEEYLIKWTIHSLRHALLTMLVTSLTTAAAFYVKILSSITSIKCFGLYAGTAIIVNYLLMIAFFPVIVIFHEKYLAACMHCCCACTCKARSQLEKSCDSSDENKLKQLGSTINIMSVNFFDRILPSFLYRTRYLCIVLLFALGIAGAVITFVSPGLNHAMSRDFQLFVSSNTLEHYELDYKRLFAFTSLPEGDRSIIFIFGINDVDNGNYFNPDSKGKLELNSGPLKIEKNQEWLKSFCENLRNASFYVHSSTCDRYLLLFQSLTSTCPASDKTCCERTLPLPDKEFLQCYYGVLLSRSPPKGITYHPIFNKEYDLKSFSIYVQTNLPYTDDKKRNEETFHALDNWLKVQKESLKEGSFSNAWWNGYDFLFYDLQVSLFKGTKESLGIALAVAFVVILVTTLNILLSLYSILTIFFIISVTIGVLVLRGWDLNIMESIIFSVAAGLAVDFTLHYSVAYQSSLSKANRVERAKDALSHIGSAVLMGAFTTFIAGLAMVPSQVLAYFQLGQFLMLTMFVSWIYSTFFFLPLCMVIGPTDNFGQLTCTKLKSARKWIGASVHPL